MVTGFEPQPPPLLLVLDYLVAGYGSPLCLPRGWRASTPVFPVPRARARRPLFRVSIVLVVVGAPGILPVRLLVMLFLLIRVPGGGGAPVMLAVLS
jgi:hypothetical protein